MILEQVVLEGYVLKLQALNVIFFPIKIDFHFLDISNFKPTTEDELQMFPLVLGGIWCTASEIVRGNPS